MKLGLVNTTHLTGDALEKFIQYYVDLGVDEFRIQHFNPKDHPNLHTTTQVDLQKEYLGSSRDYFRERGVDWFIHVDSDEFWYSPLQKNLKEYLKQVPDDVQCIKPELREYVPDSKNYFRVLMGDEDYPFKLRNDEDLGDIFFQRKFFRGTVSTKFAIRTNSDAELKVHHPCCHSHKCDDWRLLHFDVIDEEHYETKWRRKQETLDFNRTWKTHFKYSDKHTPPNKDELWRLKKLGIVEQFDIDPPIYIK